MNRRVFLAGLTGNVALAQTITYDSAKQDVGVRQPYLDMLVRDIPTEYIKRAIYSRQPSTAQKDTMVVRNDYGTIGKKEKTPMFVFDLAFTRFNENEFTVAMRQQDDVCRHIYDGLAANGQQHTIQEIARDHGELISVLFWLRASQVDNFGEDKKVRQWFSESQKEVYAGTLGYLRTVLESEVFSVPEKNLARNYLKEYGPKQLV